MAPRKNTEQRQSRERQHQSVRGVHLFVLMTGLGLAASGCGVSAATSVRSAGDLAFAIPVGSATGAEVEVVISAVDMESPIEAELAVEDGVAQGTLDGVEAGANRLVVITTYEPSGRRCSTSVNVEVAPDHLTIIDNLTLTCQNPSENRQAAIDRPAITEVRPITVIRPIGS